MIDKFVLKGGRIETHDLIKNCVCGRKMEVVSNCSSHTVSCTLHSEKYSFNMGVTADSEIEAIIKWNKLVDDVQALIKAIPFSTEFDKEVQRITRAIVRAIVQ